MLLLGTRLVYPNRVDIPIYRDSTNMINIIIVLFRHFTLTNSDTYDRCDIEVCFDYRKCDSMDIYITYVSYHFVLSVPIEFIYNSS